MPRVGTGIRTTYELRQEEMATNRKIREGLEALFSEWDAFIGSDEDGHDDVVLVGARISELRNLTNEGNR